MVNVIKVEERLIKASEIVSNINNPRTIRQDKFKKLVQSIKDFPEMLSIREIIVDEALMILGGNMRYKACLEAGLKELNVKIVKGLTEDQKKEFIIKDNANYGQWDWDKLANSFDENKLSDWGMNVWQPDEHNTWSAEEEDQTDINSLDLSEDAPEGSDKSYEEGKKVIQLEFHIDDYDEANSLVTFMKSKQYDIGEILIKAMTKALQNGN